MNPHVSGHLGITCTQSLTTPRRRIPRVGGSAAWWTTLCAAETDSHTPARHPHLYAIGEQVLGQAGGRTADRDARSCPWACAARACNRSSLSAPSGWSITRNG